MFPSFITNLFWGRNEEQGYTQLPSDEGYFITEQRDDWVLISEQGERIRKDKYVNKTKYV